MDSGKRQKSCTQVAPEGSSVVEITGEVTDGCKSGSTPDFSTAYSKTETIGEGSGGTELHSL